MEYMFETLSTPILGEYDAIVVGGGPAGCGAALSLGRAGLKTILLERQNCLGGGWTTGLVNPFFDTEGKAGIVRELITELDARGQWGGFRNISFNYEHMKHILEQKMKEAGVEVLYTTTFSRALRDGKTLHGIVAENIDGRFALFSDMIFDCTGDGNVAASAGCAFDIGVDGDYKECQAMTLMFLVGNIPEAYKDGLMIYEKLNRAYEAEGKTIPFKLPVLIPVPGTSFGVIQFTHMYEYNPLSEAERTAATMEGRQQLIDAFTFLTKHDEEFRNLELISSAGMLGVRESRRIIGEYTITVEDILSGAQFEDAVATVAFNADFHTKSNNAQHLFDVKPYTIPLRAMIPRGYDGLIVAGRCISGSREAQASYRVTADCCQMGENAAKYAVEAIRQEKNIRDIRGVNVTMMME